MPSLKRINDVSIECKRTNENEWLPYSATTDDSDGLAAALFGPKINTAYARDRSVSPIVLPKSPGLWVWDDQGPNPYEGAMAW